MSPELLTRGSSVGTVHIVAWILIEFRRNASYYRPDFNPVSKASKINRSAVGTDHILFH